MLLRTSFLVFVALIGLGDARISHGRSLRASGDSSSGHACGDNMEWTGSSCSCIEGYEAVVVGTIYQCVSICSDPGTWSHDLGHCVCPVGWTEVDNMCLETSDSSSSTTMACPDNMVWDDEAGDCVCVSGYELVDEQCLESTSEDTDKSSSKNNDKGLSGGAIAGIVIGCIAFVAILALIVIRKRRGTFRYSKVEAIVVGRLVS
mmetsp:Transcript_12477/g.24777  ORF Transcript_12477/g.24777 Transcript_12477/m.24777 type:complete len:204 (-) Transcript_12477:143-754(-)